MNNEVELEYKAVSNKSTQAHRFEKIQRMRVEKVYLNIVGMTLNLDSQLLRVLEPMTWLLKPSEEQFGGHIAGTSIVSSCVSRISN